MNRGEDRSRAGSSLINLIRINRPRRAPGTLLLSDRFIVHLIVLTLLFQYLLLRFLLPPLRSNLLHLHLQSSRVLHAPPPFTGTRLHLAAPCPTLIHSSRAPAVLPGRVHPSLMQTLERRLPFLKSTRSLGSASSFLTAQRFSRAFPISSTCFFC